MKATVHKMEQTDNTIIYFKYDVILPDPDNRLEFFQKIVGGWIDIYHEKGRDLVFNDEALLLNLPLNYWAMEKGIPLRGSIVEVHGTLD